MTHNEAVKRAEVILERFSGTPRDMLAHHASSVLNVFASELQQAYREGMEAGAVIADKHGQDHSAEADRIESIHDSEFTSPRTKSDMVASIAHTAYECMCVAEAIRTAMNKVEEK